MSRRIGLMCLVVGFVALGACTGTTTPASTAPSDDLPPGVALSFVQQHGSQGSPHAQLRVTNGSHSEMFVSGIGLAWPGFGTFLRDFDSAIGAQSVRDLPVTPSAARALERTGRSENMAPFRGTG